MHLQQKEGEKEKETESVVNALYVRAIFYGYTANVLYIAAS